MRTLPIRGSLDIPFQNGEAVGQTARQTIRGLITKVVIGSVNTSGDYDAVLHGDLAAILRADEQITEPDLEGRRLPGEIPLGNRLLWLREPDATFTELLSDSIKRTSGVNFWVVRAPETTDS